MHISKPVVNKSLAMLVRWFRYLVSILLPAGLFAISVFGALANPAHANDPLPTLPIASIAGSDMAVAEAPVAVVARRHVLAR